MKQDKYLHDLKEHVKVQIFLHFISLSSLTLFSDVWILDFCLWWIGFFVGDIYYPMESHWTGYKQSKSAAITGKVHVLLSHI